MYSTIMTLERFTNQLSYKKCLLENLVQNYILWRAVCNKKSLLKLSRIVSNASNVTEGDYSLNAILVKYHNSMDKLVKTFIRWKTYVAALINDVQKM